MIFRNYATQRDLDAAYDVEASVPDFSVYARLYTEESEDARRRLRHHANVQYGPTLDEYADIFPAAQPHAPVLIFIHGGYWRMLTAKEFAFVAKGFAPYGVTVVVANYELSPTVTIPEITRQMRSLVAWTARNIADYNGDPGEIAVCGHSAGGHLTAMCALTDWAAYGLPRDTVRYAIPISGLFDLEPIALTYLQPDLRITPRDIAEASPQRLLRPAAARMLVTLGSEEPAEFARHNSEFLAGWRAAGNRADFYLQDGRNHFTAITDLMAPRTALSAAIYDLMGCTPRTPSASYVDRRLQAGRGQPWPI